MSNHHFHLRMQATYDNNQNKVDNLNLNIFNEGEWEILDLSIRSPGFLLYANALFSCQHLYMRSNCAERGLVLESSVGELKVVTSEIWEILDIQVSFNGKLKSGAPNQDAMDYIIDRMHHCPVSTNLPKHTPFAVSVDLT